MLDQLFEQAQHIGVWILSLGNAVGSNIMNLLLVLGLAAALVPIHVVGSRRLLYRDLAFGLVPAVVLVVFARTGFISRPTALILLAIFATFIIAAITQARKHQRSLRAPCRVNSHSPSSASRCWLAAPRCWSSAVSSWPIDSGSRRR